MTAARDDSHESALGVSGRIAANFQHAHITPREEEPQINATMANVLIPFPGAALRDVEQMVAGPTEQLAPERHGDLNALLQLAVRSADGKLVPIRELVTVSDTLREQPQFHVDLLPVSYVVADMTGAIDSPLYGMFSMRGDITRIATPGGGTLQEYFIHQPEDPTATTRSSGTASRRSPTRPSATWAPPTRSAWC